MSKKPFTKPVVIAAGAGVERCEVFGSEFRVAECDGPFVIVWDEGGELEIRSKGRGARWAIDSMVGFTVRDTSGNPNTIKFEIAPLGVTLIDDRVTFDDILSTRSSAARIFSQDFDLDPDEELEVLAADPLRHSVLIQSFPDDEELVGPLRVTTSGQASINRGMVIPVAGEKSWDSQDAIGVFTQGTVHRISVTVTTDGEDPFA